MLGKLTIHVVFAVENVHRDPNVMVAGRLAGKEKIKPAGGH